MMKNIIIIMCTLVTTSIDKVHKYYTVNAAGPCTAFCSLFARHFDYMGSVGMINEDYYIISN